MASLYVISLIQALSNARVEGSFSTMKFIHSTLRNRMDVETTNAHMFVRGNSEPFDILRENKPALPFIIKTWQNFGCKDKYGSEKKVHKKRVLDELKESNSKCAATSSDVIKPS